MKVIDEIWKSTDVEIINEEPSKESDKFLNLLD